MEENPSLSLKDTFNTAMCISTRGLEGDGDFAALQNGISRLRSFMYLSTTKRLRIIESVMPITKDAPEIVETLQTMGIPHWDIAKILAGATVGHDESLINPEDGLPHFIRHCEIAVDNDPDTHTYHAD